MTTVSSSINNWIVPLLDEYRKNGISVSIICNMDRGFQEHFRVRFPEVTLHPVPFPRGTSFIGSIISIFRLIYVFTREKFDLVQYSTPNASMYAAVAAYVARIPVRLYCQWGMVYTSMQGLKKYFFEKIERLVCRLSTHVQPDSHGNLDFCRGNGFYDDSKSCVIWNGSAKGLNIEEYDIAQKNAYRQEIRERYAIHSSDLVLGFVGRLGRDKGCNELFQAYRLLKGAFPNLKLLFVGPLEKENTIEPDLLLYFKSEAGIIKTGRVSDVVKHMAAMDVFALPSYREGFGMSVVEASAMGVPVVATKYPGPSSAMIDGETGFAVPVKAVNELADSIRMLLQNAALREQMGQKGRRFAEGQFEQKQFLKKLIDNRLALLK